MSSTSFFKTYPNSETQNPTVVINMVSFDEKYLGQAAFISPREVQLKLNLNDDFKTQASALLLQRVSTEFLFTT